MIGFKIKYPNPNKFFSGVAFKFAIVTWILIIITLIFFIAISLPYRRAVFYERMEQEANNISSSIVNANQSALITEEYASIVEQCIQLVQGSNSIKFLVIKKNNGLGLVFTNEGWKIDTVYTDWQIKGDENFEVIQSDIVNEEIFQYAYHFTYSGIDWGWIFVGLSLEDYYKAIFDQTFRTIIIAVILIVFSFVISIFFTRKITNPIRVLDDITRQIANGNLNTKAEIYTNDEMQNLAESFNFMTRSLKSARDNLETRVEERTAQLAESNKALKREITERLKAEDSLNKYNFRLEALQEIYRGIIKAISVKEIIQQTLLNLQENFITFKRASVMLYETNNGNVNIYAVTKDDNDNLKQVNEFFKVDAFSPITIFDDKGYKIVNDLNEIAKKTKLEEKIYKEGIRSYVTFQLGFQDKVIGELSIGTDKTKEYSEDVINTILEINNTLALAIAQADLQENIKRNAENLQKSLEEKMVLLKEVHHRVKNNLQVISSLLYLQSEKSRDEKVLKTLMDSQSRVKSMALVHEKIYKSSDFSKINVSDYTKSLAEIIIKSFNETSKRIHLSFDIQDIFLPIDVSIPFGLIVNEVLTNIMKHAFTEQNDGNIEIGISESSDNTVTLSIKDDGKGLPDDFLEKSKASLGMQLIHNLTLQINGKLSYEENSGTLFKVIFAKPGTYDVDKISYVTSNNHS